MILIIDEKCFMCIMNSSTFTPNRTTADFKGGNAWSIAQSRIK